MFSLALHTGRGAAMGIRPGPTSTPHSSTQLYRANSTRAILGHNGGESAEVGCAN